MQYLLACIKIRTDTYMELLIIKSSVCAIMAETWKFQCHKMHIHLNQAYAYPMHISWHISCSLF